MLLFRASFGFDPRLLLFRFLLSDDGFSLFSLLPLYPFSQLSFLAFFFLLLPLLLLEGIDGLLSESFGLLDFPLHGLHLAFVLLFLSLSLFLLRPQVVVDLGFL
jgi:thiosulfate reductase cytochrome b subunit